MRPRPRWRPTVFNDYGLPIMDSESRSIEKGFHLPKLTLLEVFPLYPFLYGNSAISVIDVGANIGLWCEAFHGIFTHQISRYIAYEPMPRNAEALRSRVTTYLAESNIEVIQACAGEFNGTVPIHFDRDLTTLASVVVSRLERNDGAVVVDNKHTRIVRQQKLDEAIEEPVNLLKIDTEGYEWEVIHGAIQSIDEGMIDNVFFEFGMHQRYRRQHFKQFFDLFQGRGWHIYRQTVSRNYFGLNEIRHYPQHLEDEFASTMSMILASRSGPNPRYRGPRVTGRIN